MNNISISSVTFSPSPTNEVLVLSYCLVPPLLVHAFFESPQVSPIRPTAATCASHFTLCSTAPSRRRRQPRRRGGKGGRKADWILGMKPIAKSGDGRTRQSVQRHMSSVELRGRIHVITHTTCGVDIGFEGIEALSPSRKATKTNTCNCRSFEHHQRISSSNSKPPTRL